MNTRVSLNRDNPGMLPALLSARGTQAATTAGLSSLIVIALAVGLPITTLRNLDEPSATVGGCAIAGMIVLGAASLLINLSRCCEAMIAIGKPALVAALVFIAAHLPWLGARQFGQFGLYVTLQIPCMLVFFLGASSVQWTEARFRLLQAMAGIVTLLAFAGWLVSEQTTNYAFVFENPNTLGGYAFCASFFLWAKPAGKFSWVTVLQLPGLLAGLTVMLASGERASWLSFLAMVCTYWLWPRFSRSERLHRGYFVAVVGSLVGFLFLYTHWIEDPTFQQFDQILYTHTGKSLFSGRHNIWPLLLELWRGSPWLGLGAGFKPQRVLPYEVSAHNLFLQIAVQVGLLGLTAFLFFLLGIWKAFWRARHDRLARASGAYFAGLLTYCVFEVTLTQNNLSQALFQWLILGVGISRCRRPGRTPAVAPPQSAVTRPELRNRGRLRPPVPTSDRVRAGQSPRRTRA